VTRGEPAASIRDDSPRAVIDRARLRRNASAVAGKRGHWHSARRLPPVDGNAHAGLLRRGACGGQRRFCTGCENEDDQDVRHHASSSVAVLKAKRSWASASSRERARWVVGVFMRLPPRAPAPRRTGIAAHSRPHEPRARRVRARCRGRSRVRSGRATTRRRCRRHLRRQRLHVCR
jgi:hypothetical protein